MLLSKFFSWTELQVLVVILLLVHVLSGFLCSFLRPFCLRMMTGLSAQALVQKLIHMMVTTFESFWIWNDLQQESIPSAILACALYGLLVPQVPMAVVLVCTLALLQFLKNITLHRFGISNIRTEHPVEHVTQYIEDSQCLHNNRQSSRNIVVALIPTTGLFCDTDMLEVFLQNYSQGDTPSARTKVMLGVGDFITYGATRLSSAAVFPESTINSSMETQSKVTERTFGTEIGSFPMPSPVSNNELAAVGEIITSPFIDPFWIFKCLFSGAVETPINFLDTIQIIDTMRNAVHGVLRQVNQACGLDRTSILKKAISITAAGYLDITGCGQPPQINEVPEILLFRVHFVIEDSGSTTGTIFSVTVICRGCNVGCLSNQSIEAIIITEYLDRSECGKHGLMKKEVLIVSVKSVVVGPETTVTMSWLIYMSTEHWDIQDITNRLWEGLWSSHCVCEDIESQSYKFLEDYTAEDESHYADAYEPNQPIHIEESSEQLTCSQVVHLLPAATAFLDLKGIRTYDIGAHMTGESITFPDSHTREYASLERHHHFVWIDIPDDFVISDNLEEETVVSEQDLVVIEIPDEFVSIDIIDAEEIFVTEEDRMISSSIWITPFKMITTVINSCLSASLKSFQ